MGRKGRDGKEGEERKAWKGRGGREGEERKERGGKEGEGRWDGLLLAPSPGNSMKLLNDIQTPSSVFSPTYSFFPQLLNSPPVPSSEEKERLHTGERMSRER